MRKSLLLLVFCILASVGATAYAQVGRLLPQNGERGKTGASHPLPAVKIGSKLMRLAPGGLIYDQHNRSVVHSQLPQNADVLYLRDQAGNIQRIYVLTELERALFDRAGKR
jgi:hypothetical protein